jgi:DNA-binding SARP family transcriptional activator
MLSAPAERRPDRRKKAQDKLRLLVARDGSRFSLDGVEARLSKRRHTARSILLALARAHPQAVGAEALIQAGWPEAEIGWSAARNRLHVAIHGLRNLGLEAALVRTRGGYAIDPGVEVVWEEAKDG